MDNKTVWIYGLLDKNEGNRTDQIKILVIFDFRIFYGIKRICAITMLFFSTYWNSANSVVTCIEDLYTVTFYLKLRNLNLSFIKITKYLYSKFESYLGNVKLDFTDYKAMKNNLDTIRKESKSF